MAPKYTNFERGARRKIKTFFSLRFSKSAIKRLFGLIFQNSTCGGEHLAKKNLFSEFRLQKNFILENIVLRFKKVLRTCLSNLKFILK